MSIRKSNHFKQKSYSNKYPRIVRLSSSPKRISRSRGVYDDYVLENITIPSSIELLETEDNAENISQIGNLRELSFDNEDWWGIDDEDNEDFDEEQLDNYQNSMIEDMSNMSMQTEGFFADYHDDEFTEFMELYNVSVNNQNELTPMMAFIYFKAFEGFKSGESLKIMIDKQGKTWIWKENDSPNNVANEIAVSQLGKQLDVGTVEVHGAINNGKIGTLSRLHPDAKPVHSFELQEQIPNLRKQLYKQILLQYLVRGLDRHELQYIDENGNLKGLDYERAFDDYDAEGLAKRAGNSATPNYTIESGIMPLVVGFGDHLVANYDQDPRELKKDILKGFSEVEVDKLKQEVVRGIIDIPDEDKRSNIESDEEKSREDLILLQLEKINARKSIIADILIKQLQVEDRLNDENETYITINKTPPPKPDL